MRHWSSSTVPQAERGTRQHRVFEPALGSRLHRTAHVQVLAFARLILEDLSNYDANGAWPTLIDEYVCAARSKHVSKDVSEADMSPSALNQANLLPLSVPAQPGSKRQHADIEAEAEDLAEQLSGMHADDVRSANDLPSAAAPPFKAKRCKHSTTGQLPQTLPLGAQDAVVQTLRNSHSALKHGELSGPCPHEM